MKKVYYESDVTMILDTVLGFVRIIDTFTGDAKDTKESSVIEFMQENATRLISVSYKN